ncbi:hypothetical protein SSS_01585 [Sarcoptes scabiei]|uniref:Ig-like domain-containing protein n=1 Tax=Sarcoptes scabiei TaxID=52283 RepID=A0A834VA72_SARSC|nr:hypothetical protein SSS_01585 [Sarcoptes scabiei]
MFIWIVIVLLAIFFIANRFDDDRIDVVDNDDDDDDDDWDCNCHRFKRPDACWMIYRPLILASNLHLKSRITSNGFADRNNPKHLINSNNNHKLSSSLSSPSSSSSSSSPSSLLIKYQNLGSISNGSDLAGLEMVNGHENNDRNIDNDFCDDHNKMMNGSIEGYDSYQIQLQSKNSTKMNPQNCFPSKSHLNGDVIDGEHQQYRNNILAEKEEEIEDDLCSLCRLPFDLSRHKRLQCRYCSLACCLSCSLFEDNDWMCLICHQQRSIVNEAKCQSHLCKRILTKVQDRNLLHFSDAKSRLLKNRFDSMFTNCDDNVGTVADDADDDGENQSSRNLAQNFDTQNSDIEKIRDEIETILAKLLGFDTVDHSHIGLVFEDLQYSQLIEKFIPILSESLQKLQESIYSIDYDNERESKSDSRTPSDAYQNLKELLHEISERSFERFTMELRPRKINIEEIKKFIDTTQSYEYLLANSIVNQIIEDSQSRFMTTSSSTTLNIKANSIPSLTSSSMLTISDHYFYHQNNQPQQQQQQQNQNLNRFVKINSINLNNNNHYHHRSTSTLSNFIENPSDGIHFNHNQTHFNDSIALNNYNNNGHHHHHHTAIEKNCRKQKIVPNDCQNCDRSISRISNNMIYAPDDDYDQNGGNGSNKTVDGDHLDHREIDSNEIDTNYYVTDDDSEYFDEENDDYDEPYENDFGLEFNFEQRKVYFPEAGLDLIDSKKFSSMDSNISQDSGIKLIDNTQTWEDNWFFKKNKENKSYNQYHLNSDIHFGYMALALSEPVPMLIPNPSPIINPMLGDCEIDQVSDLSEHNSETGSIIFSSDDEGDQKETTRANQQQSNQTDLIETNHSDDRRAKSKTVYIANQNKTATNQRNDRSFSSSSSKTKALLERSRWNKIKVPEFVPNELRTICSSIPNSHFDDLDCIPNLIMKPGSAKIHSGIVAQFCCKANGLMPMNFAWFKDGHLIAASDDSRTPEELENNRFGRLFFGVRFTHRRYVESSCSSYRLIVFNDNECILELKKSRQIDEGVYSVVAYNHAGHDWCDFKLSVDRNHFTANVHHHHHHHLLQQKQQNQLQQQQQQPYQTKPKSPRPVLRRPQNKIKKITTEIIIPLNRSSNQSMMIANHYQQPTTRMPVSVIQRTWNERQALLLLSSQHNTNTNNNSRKLLKFIQDNLNFSLPNQSNYLIDQNIRTKNPSIVNESNVHKQEDCRNLEQKNDTINHQLNRIHGEISEEIINNDPMSLTNISSIDSIPVMTIAEREHRKWEHPDVDLVNNPYSPENIEKRNRNRLISPDYVDSEESYDSYNHDQNDFREEEIVPEEKRKFFSSSRDLDLYKRDYYLPKNSRKKPNDYYSFSILNTLGSGKQSTTASTKTPVNEYSLIEGSTTEKGDLDHKEVAKKIESKDHNHNDCDRNLNNQTEIVINVIESQEKTIDSSETNSPTIEIQITELKTKASVGKKPQASGENENEESIESNTSEPNRSDSNETKDDYLNLFGQNRVKSLTSLFSSSLAKQQEQFPLSRSSSSAESSSKSISPTLNRSLASTETVTKQTINMNAVNNYAVHSLTGRSMTKAFREQSQKNLPKFTEMNRVSLANGMLSNSINDFNEREENDNESMMESKNDESLKSIESDRSISSTTSSNDNLMRKSSRKDGTGAIKKRAVFWEKRIESSQLSDSQVKEAFPTMDGSVPESK